MLIRGEDLRARSDEPLGEARSRAPQRPCTATGDGSEAISSYQTPAASAIRAARSVLRPSLPVPVARSRPDDEMPPRPRVVIRKSRSSSAAV